MDTDVLNGLGRKTLGVQWIHVTHDSIVHRQHFGVLKLDTLFAVRRNRVDARTESVSAHIFQERRVLLFPDDIFVDTARLIPVQHLSFEPLTIHIHCKFGNGGMLR